MWYNQKRSRKKKNFVPIRSMSFQFFQCWLNRQQWLPEWWMLLYVTICYCSEWFVWTFVIDCNYSLIVWLQCLPCKSLGRTDCDKLQPSCTTCTTRLTICSYSSNTSINFKEVETRLKKLEAQLNPQKQSSAKRGSLATSVGDLAEQKKAKQQQPQHHPQFRLEENQGGLCIDTKITEAHHFIKLLFNSVDLELVRKRAQNIFNTPLPSTQSPNSSSVEAEEPAKVQAILREIMTTRDPIECKWLDTVWQTRHHGCFVVYQMVDKHRLKISALPTDERELLLNMSIRAYMYHHENDLHQDTEYHIQSTKGNDYLLCAEELLERCYISSHRTTIRALLHLYAFHILDERPNRAFQYSDLALRMALDLKLNTQHRDEDDRRLWWSAYWCHLYLVVEYDRPSFATDQDCCQVPWPTKQAHEGFDSEYCLNYCIMSIQLLRIRKRISQALRNKYMSVNDLLKQVSKLEKDLEQWYKQIPDCAQANGMLCMELNVLLHAQYSSVKMQTHQCFLENATALSLVALKECAKAAGSVADRMLQSAPTMRMCICARAMPAIRRSVAFYLSNFLPSKPAFILNEAKEKLRQWMMILNSHSFVYLPESQALVAKLSIVLSEKLESISSPGADTIQSDSTRSDGDNTKSLTSNNSTSGSSNNNNNNNSSGSYSHYSGDNSYYRAGGGSTPQLSDSRYNGSSPTPPPPPARQQTAHTGAHPLHPYQSSILKPPYKDINLSLAKQNNMIPFAKTIVQQSNPIIDSSNNNRYASPAALMQSNQSTLQTQQAEAYNYVAEPLQFMPTTMNTTNYMPSQQPPPGADPYLTPIPTAPLILPSSVDTTQWPLYQVGPLPTNTFLQQHSNFTQYPTQQHRPQQEQQAPQQAMGRPEQQ